MAGELSVDEYQRSRFAADLLEHLRGADGPLAVLDVGGRGGMLEPFLPEDRVVALDLAAPGGALAVRGDGCRLPFGDASFDAVVACDTLQHVPQERRELFLRECRRVARRWVLLVGPYRAPRVEQAESALRTFLVEKLGQETPELDAHARHGLPSQSFVEARLRELGGRVASIGHGNLERWLATACLSSYLLRDRVLQPVARELHRFYNEFAYRRDLGEPAYRHAVVAAFGDAALIEPEDFARGLGERDEGGEAGLQLARELAAFDVARDVVQPEWDRLRARIARLEEELERARALAVERESAAPRVAELEAELARVREVNELERAAREESVRAFRRELDQERVRRAEYERKVATEDAGARRKLEEQLAVERQRLEALVSEATTLSDQLERQRARAERDRLAYGENISSMELDLGSYRQLVADMGQQVASQETQLNATRGALQAAQAELESLRSDGLRAGEIAVELRQAVSLADNLQMELGGRDHEILRKQAQLEAALVETDRLARQLAGERETNEELRRQLGGRFSNLRRAFSPKLSEDDFND